MSASSRIVRSAAQTSFIGARALQRSSLSPTAAYLRRNARTLPSQMPALAILIPRRGVTTDTHTSGGANGAPPPGFNAEQARKPIKETPISSNATSKAAAKQAGKHEIDSIPSNEATGVAKTDASEGLTLSELAGSTGKSVEKPDGEKAEKKLTLGQKIKKEAAHYWDGTKLLGTEIKISSRLALKMAAGYELSRREHRQLRRTVQDMARLVPFSVFVLVPFAELLLPIALKLFPNMLPSTYEAQKSKDAKVSSLRATRKDVSNFLRSTLKETGLPLGTANAHIEEFAQFFRKVRATGETPSASEVIKVCQIFKDDLTLDNLSRPSSLVRHRMRQIKRDDRAISFEGVESLSVPELQVACLNRGIRTHGMSPGRLRDDLQAWLELRLKHGVPSTLLVLSNAFMYAQGKEAEFSTQIDALTGVLSSIPEELFHEIELEVHNAEGAATNKQRLEVLKEQQELIEEENEQNEENTEEGRATPQDNEDIDEKEERRMEAKDGADKDQVSEAIASEKDGELLKQEDSKAREEKP
ncbi:mrs7 family protein [Botrytis cinerea]